MVAIDDIKDEDSFRAWLEETGQSQKACIWLAHRAAMRVLPGYWHWVATSDTARERGLTAMPILRVSLISGVTSLAPTPDTGRAAYAAAYAADPAAAAAAHAAGRAAHAAADTGRAAYAAAYTGRAAYAAEPAAYAGRAARADDPAAYAALRRDCQTLVDTNSQVPRISPALWDSTENTFAKDWQTLRDNLDPHQWWFWLDWYSRALEGTEDRWPLLERIALSNLDPRADGKAREPGEFDAFWKGSDAEVNARIDQVFLDERKPPALELEAKEQKTEAAPEGEERSEYGKQKPLHPGLGQQVQFVLNTAPATSCTARFAAMQIETAVSEFHKQINVNRSEEGDLMFAIAGSFVTLADAIDAAMDDASNVSALEATIAAQQMEIERLTKLLSDTPSARSQILIGAIGGAGATAITGAAAMVFGPESIKTVATLWSFVTSAGPVLPPSPPPIGP